MDQDPQTLLERCADPGWTPGARDVAALLDAWEREPDRAIVRALARGDEGVARRLLAGLRDASGAQRAARLAALGRLSQRIPVPQLPGVLRDALADGDPRVVREAARAIAKLADQAGAGCEGPLLTVAATAAIPERKVAVDALGRIGGEATLAALRAERWPDEDLARRAGEAIALLERRTARARPARIDPERPLPAPMTIVLRCRAGLAGIVAQQVAHALADAIAAAPRITARDPATVTLRWAGPLRPLHRVRSALDVAIEHPLARGRELEDRIVDTLLDPTLLGAIAAWTEGTARFRLAFGGGGHRRALVWSIARRLGELAAPLVNDTRDVGWTIEVDEAGRGRVACRPHGADDRFAWRVAEIPAASHPTLAAALAFAARPQAGEVVWDPFCGSGLELVECARLAPDLQLLGTDTDPAALDAARRNLAAAGIVAGLAHADALAHTPSPFPSLIVTNPPMGRRLARDGSLRRTLASFVAHAARVLAPGGRIVLLTPSPRVTLDAARDAGLDVRDDGPVDMGGFPAHLQVLARPPVSGGRSFAADSARKSRSPRR
jgi:SAM-dependent methyltransferase